MLRITQQGLTPAHHQRRSDSRQRRLVHALLDGGPSLLSSVNAIQLDE